MATKKVRPGRTPSEWWAWKLSRLRRPTMRCDYVADNLGVSSTNLAFLSEPNFAAGWDKAARLGAMGWHGNVPDIRWRAHFAVWCASNALRVEGDFIECGVHTGLLSITICEVLGFASVPKTFWLFDTWAGIPVETLAGESREAAARLNASHYNIDLFESVRQSFAAYPNVKLVRGILPASLADAPLEKIAYLSIDLNNAQAEKDVIEALWPKISPGGTIVLDDYGSSLFVEQHDMWDRFAQRVDRRIVTLPTGQGLLVR